MLTIDTMGCSVTTLFVHTRGAHHVSRAAVNRAMNRAGLSTVSLTNYNTDKEKGDKENEVIFLRKALELSKKKHEINLIKSKLEQASR